ncbi:Vacuolar protein-sorting-associated protein 28 [Perkinsus chesapeaki]|uniref:alpha-galactosidase n=1 Tax=Perkinsus chesapeaki TaxID=330153 RepID=A0A7J6N0N3_PERCH|nr:Vacuolar protein-sorting-associated protein 28 [Perkinsus chesapeaki]
MDELYEEDLEELSPLPLASGQEGYLSGSGGGIIYDRLQRIFRLYTTDSMYAFRITTTGQLEHLYWGPSIPPEDDLTFLSLNSLTMASPFDPTGQAEPVGIRELTSDMGKKLQVEDLSERWKTYTKEAKSGIGEDVRRENAFWRRWRMAQLGRSDSPKVEIGADLDGQGGEIKAKRDRTVNPLKLRSNTLDLEVCEEDKPLGCGKSDGRGAPDAAPVGRISSPLGTLRHDRKAQDGSPTKALPSWVHQHARRQRSSSAAVGPMLERGKSVGHGRRFTTHAGRPSSPSRSEEEAGATHVTQQIMGKNSLMLEYSDYGTGDYRLPSFKVRYNAESRLGHSDISPLEYRDHIIVRGKPLIVGDPDASLPQVRCENQMDAVTLELNLQDRVSGLVVTLYYSVFPEWDVLVRRAKMTNPRSSGSAVGIDRFVSVTSDFEAGNYYFTHFGGSWGREGQRMSQELMAGAMSIGSTRGVSSHMHNPMGIISKGAYNEDAGYHWGFIFMYSGSFLIECEINETNRLRVNVGFNPMTFKWKLFPGESLSTPETLIIFSSSGATGLTHKCHRILQDRVMPPRWRYTRPPVVCNTWESMYFNITDDRVMQLAKHAAAVGAEMVVIDDGWFTNRNDDTGGLGDWEVDKEKLPLGIPHLCNAINQLGLAFGIWIEPEMASPGCHLLQKYNDCTLQAKNRPMTMRRHQFLLDFSQERVRRYVLKKLRGLLSCCNIAYVKWDMNRHLTEAQSALLSDDRPQGETMHRHMLGVYQVLDSITSEFPLVRFETCAGGGGRFDAGMLYFGPQIWASDNTDACCRARIQAGLSVGYPMITMGSHITATPNHQTGRILPGNVRGVMSMLGAMGVELNLMKADVELLTEIRALLHVYKTTLDFNLLRGKFYRLWDPFDAHSTQVYGAEVTAWMQVAEDQSRAVVMACLLHLKEVGKIIPRLQLKGLSEDTLYEIIDLAPSSYVRNPQTLQVVCNPVPVSKFSGVQLMGVTLMKAGLPLQFLFDGDCSLFEIRSVELGARPEPAGSVDFTILKAMDSISERSEETSESSLEDHRWKSADGKFGSGILYDRDQRIFRLYTAETLYAFRITTTGQLEHLYWGPSIPPEDDLTFLSLNSLTMASPFDPTGQARPAGGIREITSAYGKGLEVEDLSERWKTYSREAKSGIGEDLRRENAFWRRWRMSQLERAEENVEPGSIEETEMPGGQQQDGALPSWSKQHVRPRRGSSIGSPAFGRGMTMAFGGRRASAFAVRPSSPSRSEEEAGATHVTQQIMGKNSLMLEYSDYGTGDYRLPSFKVRYNAKSKLGHSDISPMEYVGHRIHHGKARISGAPHSALPQVRCESDEEAVTLEVDLMDLVSGLTVTLYYSVFPKWDVIVRKAKMTNPESAGFPVGIDQFVSTTSSFESGNHHLTHFGGSWGREVQKLSVKLQQGSVRIESTRGVSSHMHNPMCVISKGQYNEDAGYHWGFMFVYSGSFLIECETNETNRLRVNVGFNPLTFKWKLHPGESITTPETITVFSSSGATSLTHKLHRILQDRVIPARFRYTRPPVVCNTWESMYFDVTHDRVMQLARHAAAVGAEMVVIDDGWFTNRNDDTGGLGDWEVDKEKLPFGIPHLCNAISQLGLAFGIWIEPEMASPGCHLLQKYNDCTLQAKNRPMTMRRHQFLLDFSQERVRRYVLKKLRGLLSCCNIAYVKWDMNRHLTEAQSALLSDDRPQGETMHRHMLGVYQVLDSITSEFPLTGRTLPGNVRGGMSMLGAMGVELNLMAADVQLLEEIKDLLYAYKSSIDSNLLKGKFYRLWDPFDIHSTQVFGAEATSWMQVAHDKSRAIVMVCMLHLKEVGKIIPRLQLKGLSEDTLYEIIDLAPSSYVRNPQTLQVVCNPVPVSKFSGVQLMGVTLMKAGLPLQFLFDGDCSLFEIRSVELGARPEPAGSVDFTAIR